MKALYELFPEVALESTGRKQDLHAVENLVAGARTLGSVRREDLSALENSEAWSYGGWWPRLSKTLVQPVRIVATSSGSARKLVQELQGAVHHIKVVSVLLRFVLPESFGIYSPPVASLLGLVPSSNEVDTYIRYCKVLRTLGELHQLSRVADVDMALWTASRPSNNRLHGKLCAQMHADARFQGLVLSNFADGLSRRGRWTELHRLALARGLLRHDSVSAAALAAPVFEDLLAKVAQVCRVRLPSRDEKSFLHELVSAISHNKIFQNLGVAWP